MTNDIVARLRQTHPAHCKCFGCEAADEIARLCAERDEARKEICHTKKRRLITHLDYARKRGWNCFWVDYSKRQEETP
jgi:hypothetical protein